MDLETQIIILGASAGGVTLFLLILVVVLFSKVSKLNNRLASDEPSPTSRPYIKPVQGPVRQPLYEPQGRKRSHGNDELARRGYTVYSPPASAPAQSYREEGRQQSGRKQGPVPPPKKSGGGALGFGGFAAKAMQSDGFGQVAAGEFDTGNAMDFAGGLIENEDIAGVLQSNAFQYGVNSGIQYGANKALSRQEQKQNPGRNSGKYF